jgi:MerR family mercuric resistance operon transcriptional regulator
MGLIPRPAQRQSGDLRYTHEHLHLIRIIRRANAIGFSLAEIAALSHRQPAAANEACTLLRQKLDRVELQIAELQRWRVALLELMVFGSQGMPALLFLAWKLAASTTTNDSHADSTRH